MARQYRTSLIITGDASGGIRAIRDTDDQLGRLNRGFERGTQRSRSFQREVGSTSTELAALRRAAAPLAATLAGVFAANTLKSQIDFADQLQKTNIRIGASTEALSEYQLVAKLSGVEFNQLATAWQRQTRRIAQAAEGTGEAQAALESLNLSAKDLSQLAPEQQFEHIARAMQGVASEAERVALAQKVWDSEGVRLLQIVNQGTDAIEAMRQQARDLGLSISGETANAMAGFNDQLDTLSFAAQGVSQTMLAELVPSLSAALQSLNAFIADAGGAEEVLGDLATIGGTLASVYAGRVVASLASSTAALTARTVASIRDARAEAAAAQAVARRTAAELASAKALLSTARLEAAATKGTSAHTFALSQLSAARVRATTAAGAHSNATNVATAAMGRASVAARGLSGALALAGGPLGLLVGAAGLLYVFRDELRLTGDRLGLTEDEASDFQDELDDLSNKDMSHSLDSLNSALDQATLKAAAAREEIARLKSEDDGYSITGIGNLGDQVSGYNALGDAKRKLAKIEQKRNMSRIELWGRWSEEVNSASSATDNNTESTDDNSESQTQLSSSISDAEKAQAALSKATAKQADELESLRKQLDPAYAATQKLAKSTAILQKGLASGLGVGEYTKLLAKAAKGYLDFGNEAEDATDKAGDNTDEMADLFERSMERMDDASVDMWRSFLDGSEDAFGSFKNLALDTLAEVIHQYTTRQITASIGGNFSIGGGAGGAGGQGGQGGGFGLDSLNPGMIKKGWDTVSGYFGAGAASSGAATGYAGAGWAGSATNAGGWYGSATASGATGGAASGSLAGGAMGGLYTAGAGLAGGYVGTELGGAFTDKQANSNYGATGGAAIGAYVGSIVPVIGTYLGAALGGALGGLGDTLFGSYTPFKGRFGTVSKEEYDQSESTGNYVFEHQGPKAQERDGTFFGESALGAVGFRDSGTERLQKAGTGDKQWAEDLASATAAADNMIATLARSESELDAMRNTVQGLEASSSRAGDIIEFALVDRPLAAVEAAGYDIGQTLEDAIEASKPANAAKDLVRALSLENLGDEIGGGIEADIESALSDVTGASLDGVLSGIEKNVVAFQALSPVVERLNLNFDDAARGALAASGNISTLVGGVKNLAQMQTSYYQQYFTEAERAANMQSDLTDVFAKYNAKLPKTRDAYRALVESQDLSTKAGQENYAALLEVAGSFDQLREAQERVKQANGEVSDSANDAADSVVDMSKAIRARESLDRELLKAQGDTDALRQLELDSLKEINGWEEKGLVTLQNKIWALEDEQQAQKKAEKAAKDHARALEKAQADYSQFTQNISSWLDNLRSTDKGVSSPTEQYGSAESSFEKALSKAQGGDREALKSITGYADRYLSAAEDMYASGTGAVSVQDRIESALEKLPDQVSAEQFLADEFNSSITGLGATIDQRFADLTGSIADNFGVLDGNLDGKLTFSELKRGLAGKATDAEIRAMIAAMDVNNDGVISGLESVIIKSMPTDYRLGLVLKNQLEATRNKQLTHAQVRDALSPIASDDKINALIKRADKNADGIITAQELGNASISGLSAGFAGAIAREFDSVDIDVSGAIDLSEFSSAFDGMASDKQLKSIFSKLDTDGSRTISKLEAIRGTSKGTQGNTSRIGSNDFLIDNPLMEKGMRSIDRQLTQLRRQFPGYTPHALGGVFADGGAFTNSIVSQPTAFDMGLMGEAGPEAIMPLTRHGDGSLGVRAELPALPPLLGVGDVVEVLQDLKRENRQLRQDINRLLGEGNKHAAASVNVQQAGFSRQINEQQKSNRVLGEMSGAARLEGSR